MGGFFLIFLRISLLNSPPSVFFQKYLKKIKNGLGKKSLRVSSFQYPKSLTMTEEKYRALLAKYLNGQCTDEERALLDEWYEALDADAVKNTKKDSYTEGGDKAQFDKNWAAIKATIEAEKDIAQPRWTKWYWAAAASLAIMVNVAAYLWFKPQAVNTENRGEVVETNKNKPAPTFIEKRNTSRQDMRLELSDGSVVVLKPNSALSYPDKFESNKREIRLEGEAFFDVAKNPFKPFLVYTNDVTVKVLGTSFTVKSNKDTKNVTVDVQKGKVSVYSEKMVQTPSKSDPETIGVVLTPNQSVRYLSTENRLVKSLVEEPVVLIPKEDLKKFTFSEAPIAQIFAALETAYGIDIIYDEDVMRDCTMTTTLEDENLHEKLAIICKLLRASYKMVDAQVVISSKGCS
jgi:transmembrane sensor